MLEYAAVAPNKPPPSKRIILWANKLLDGALPAIGAEIGRAIGRLISGLIVGGAGASALRWLMDFVGG